MVFDHAVQDGRQVRNKLLELMHTYEIEPQILHGLLGVTAETLDAWLTLRSLPDPREAARLAQIENIIRFNCRQYWMNRITNSSGKELLCDGRFCIVAISQPALKFPDTHLGRPIELPPSAVLGRHFNDLLPEPMIDIFGDGAHGLDSLADRGFFEGRVSWVRYRAEAHFGIAHLHSLWEVFPVPTLDAGVLVHSRRHDLHKDGLTLTAPGMRVAWSEVAYSGRPAVARR